MTSQTIETIDLKNIFWHEKRQAYIVHIQRYGESFYKAVYSLDDAIILRDRVIEFFKKHRRKPSSKELNIDRKKMRVERKESQIFKCQMCNSEISYDRSKPRKLFLERNCICGHCYRLSQSDLEILEDQSSEKHITFEKSSGLYIVQIKRFNQVFYHRAETLEGAKSLRNKVIAFYIKYNRLPDSDEKTLLLDIKPKRKHEFVSNARSNTNEKHISRRGSRYSVVISRDCKFFRSAAESLEQAIEIRDRALEYFDHFGVLPTSKQLMEYIN